MALLQKVLATKMKADFSLPINASMIRLFPHNRSTSKMQKADSRGNHRLVVLSAQAGYQQAAESQLGYFQAQLDELANYIESFEAMYSEPLIFDDSLRVGIEEFLKQIVLACEILILLDEASAVAGICIFNPVRKDINYGSSVGLLQNIELVSPISDSFCNATEKRFYHTPGTG
jgi:hypothetical protein